MKPLAGFSCVFSLCQVLACVLSLGACKDEHSFASCFDPLVECEGTCVNLSTDPNHCGSCETTCAEGEVCSAGQCGLTCLGGTTLCDGLCVDPQIDPSHCGDCDTACVAGEVCSAGQCL